MSHVATMTNCPITDLDALEAACEKLGLELRRDQKTYAWWGTSVGDYALPAGMTAADLGKCEHAIRVKGSEPVNGPGGPWEIGLVRNAAGALIPIFDFFGGAGGALTQHVGQGCATLKTEYESEVILRELYRQGCRVEITQDADGTRHFAGVR